MFYCEACRDKNKWPKSIGGSYGNCEVCGFRTSCYDFPSSALPPAPKTTPASNEIRSMSQDEYGKLSDLISYFQTQGCDPDSLRDAFNDLWKEHYA